MLDNIHSPHCDTSSYSILYNCVNVGNEEKKDNKNQKQEQIMLYLSRGFGLAGKRVKQIITLNPGRFRPHHRFPKYNKYKLKTLKIQKWKSGEAVKNQK